MPICSSVLTSYIMKLFVYGYFLCQPVNSLGIELSHSLTVIHSALSGVTGKFYEDFVVGYIQESV